MCARVSVRVRGSTAFFVWEYQMVFHFPFSNIRLSAFGFFLSLVGFVGAKIGCRSILIPFGHRMGSKIHRQILQFIDGIGVNSGGGSI